MRWKSFRAQLIEFSLSWKMVGVSFPEVMELCRKNGPTKFKTTSGRNHFEWKHQVESPWPGNYATIGVRHSPDLGVLEISVVATPTNVAYPEGLQFLASLIKIHHATIEEIRLSFAGDGYEADVQGPIAREQLDSLLSDVVIDMDEAMNSPWPQSRLYLALEERGDELFLRRL